MLAAPAMLKAASGQRVAVIGAGAFGAWTAHRLRETGRDVLLVDAWGPAHARASSGGESRMTRGAYGASELYTRMARDSLADWKLLSDAAGLPVFHRCGVLFFFPEGEAYVEESLAVHRRLGLSTELLGRAAMQRRFPMIDFAGIDVGLWEAEFGVLMARRSIQTLVERFVRAGGTYARAAVAPPAASGTRLGAVMTSDGGRIEADQFVFACGPWLPKLFPGLLASRIFPTRQEVFFFAPEAGDDRFGPARLPGWADFNQGDIYYGMPDLEARGFKIAHDRHGPPIDPDRGDRAHSPAALAEVRAYLAKRFPALADRPLVEARVCQYENSANGDLLVDFHPELENVLLVGAGSGHGFKHGPAVGRYAADLLTGRLAAAEPRFSLASKGESQAREVH
jgi:glycine/D-amino acid oxidase-like deaminating enzyme